MTPRSRRIATWSMAAASLAMVAGACSDDDASGTSASSQAPGGDSAAGSVVVSGSSTVEPISARVAEMMEDSGSSVAVTVDGPGTGDGFAAFCAGEADIADASRPIKGEEVELCAENGIDFVELRVGVDGIAVMTSSANTSLECLSFADLYAIVGPESVGFADWSDAQALASELGSDTTFPEGSLDITAPGEESGTFDSFIEIALEGIGEERAEAGHISEDDAATTRPDYTSQANDNAILQGIEGSPTSFGWVGFAFAENAGDGIATIAISEEPGGECVEATPETIASNEYPISRDLFIYVSLPSVESNPAVAEYVDFYLGEGMAAVAEVGYVALTDDAIEATRANWESRTTGSLVGA